MRVAPPFRVFCERVGQHEPKLTLQPGSNTRCPILSRFLRKGGTARTKTHPSTRLEHSLPHPFACFAKGWDSTNQSSPFNPARMLRAPSFRVFCERVGQHEPKLTLQPRSNAPCPILSRFLRKGGTARTKAHPSTPLEHSLPHPFAFFAKGWDSTNQSSPFNPARTLVAPSFRVFCERVGQPEPKLTLQPRSNAPCPILSRFLRKGGTARTKAHPSTPLEHSLPHPFAFFAKGWDSTNLNHPHFTQPSPITTLCAQRLLSIDDSRRP